jgi:hypothetical protein
MKKKVLLVTTVPYSSAARLAGAFSALGATVEAVFPREAPIAVSRYLDRAYCYRPLASEESLADALRAAQPDFVIPCDDRAVALLAGLLAFAPQLERCLGPLAAYRVVMARAPSMAAAREEGIIAPLTCAVDSLAALPDALHEVGLPCVMKTDFSWGGAGVKFVCSADEARRAFVKLQGPPSRLRSLVRAVKRKDLHFLDAARNPVKATVNLQAFVAGKPATSVFAAEDGKVLAAQHMDVVTWQGDAGPATVMARVADPVMDDAVAKIAARFRLSGLHGLDFVRDAAGLPHLIEVNPRATQICHLPLDADLPAALLGVPARLPVTDRKQIALFPQLLSVDALPPQVFRDIPWDDPKVLRFQSGEALPEAAELEAIAEFDRPVRRFGLRPPASNR